MIWHSHLCSSLCPLFISHRFIWKRNLNSLNLPFRMSPDFGEQRSKLEIQKRDEPFATKHLWQKKVTCGHYSLKGCKSRGICEILLFQPKSFQWEKTVIFKVLSSNGYTVEEAWRVKRTWRGYSHGRTSTGTAKWHWTWSIELHVSGDFKEHPL